MLQTRATRRRIITYATLVAVSLLMLAGSKTAPLQDLRHGINFALSPVQETLARSTRSVTSIFNAVAEIDQLRRDNLQLAAQVQQLEVQTQQLEALRTQNEQLSKLLGLRGTLDFNTQPAAVIARQATQYERVITLNRGTDSGIAVGDPVLADGGALAGVVVDAGSNYSSVMLLNDTRSIVIGLVESSRATGEVEGRLSGPLAMTQIPSPDKVAVDDTVVTAGLDLGGAVRAAFPAGLLIGRVVDVREDPSAIVQVALIQPVVNLDKLELVLVMTDFQPPDVPRPGSSPGPGRSPKPSKTP
jgi:rod shape-determining protein MreC